MSWGVSGLKHHLYVITAEEYADTGPVKIGVSTNPGYRVLALQTGNHRVLYLYWHQAAISRGMAFDIEKEFKQQFSDECLCGEWFNLKPVNAARVLDGMIEYYLLGDEEEDALANA